MTVIVGPVVHMQTEIRYFFVHYSLGKSETVHRSPGLAGRWRGRLNNYFIICHLVKTDPDLSR